MLRTTASPHLRQSLTALGPFLITICIGMTEGYSAILLPQLDVSPSLSSWIASIAALPMALGCILGGILMEKIGRKSIHILTCFPCILGWLVIYFSTNTPMLLAGRFITGFCVGLLGPPTGVYLSETSQPNFRGLLLAAISSAIAFGLFLVHLFGTFLSWKNTCLACCTFPVFSVISMLFTPESPTWLIKKGRIEEGSVAFKWCRGETPETERELSILIERQAELNSDNSKNKRNVLEVLLNELNKPEFYKPLILIVIFFVACQWSGLNAITFYSITILQQTLHGKFDEYLAMLLIDIVRVAASVLACVLQRKLGRRHLALISGVGTFLSLFSLSLFNFLSTGEEEGGVAMIPLVGLVCYVLFITVGFVPLPWTLMGEMFPLSGRGVGSGISALTGYVAFFSVVKTTPEMFLSLGVGGTFLVYGLVAFGGTVILGVFLPETKDKALHEIEDCFKNDKHTEK